MKNPGIRLKIYLLQALLLLLFVACLTPISVSEEIDCNEKIVIDSVEYLLPERWCGKKLDSLDIADPKILTKLPDSLTFEDYRIYVLPETRDAFLVMSSQARKDSIFLIIDSGFRNHVNAANNTAPVIKPISAWLEYLNFMFTSF